jgi:GPI mannosyltransferase 3
MQPKKQLYQLLLPAAIGIFLWAAWMSEGYYHPDEHFQIIEFGQYLLGVNDQTDLAWEFKAQIRPALQPMMAAGLIGFFRLIGLENPFYLAFILRAITALAALGVYVLIARMAAAALPQSNSKSVFLSFCAFMWFMPFLSVRFSSEQWAAITFLLGIYWVVHYADSPKNRIALLGAGVFWGLSFFLRFQMAFALLGVFVWMIFIQKRGLKDLALLVVGGLVAGAFCMYLDSILYGKWVFTPYNYYKSNIVEGKAASFGTEPWWWYFGALFFDLIIPISMALFLLAAQGIRNHLKHVFLWALVPFLLGHMLIGHKELRFLFPMAVPFLFLVAAGWLHWQERLGKNVLFKGVAALLILFNVFFLVARSSIPALPYMPYYHFLYEAAQKQPVQLIGNKASIYGAKNTVNERAYTVNFYKPTPTIANYIGNVATLDSFNISGRANERIFLIQQEYKQQTLQKYHIKPVLRIKPWYFPGIYTPQQWRDRKPLWQLYELTKKNNQ